MKQTNDFRKRQTDQGDLLSAEQLAKLDEIEKHWDENWLTESTFREEAFRVLRVARAVLNLLRKG